MSKPKSLLQKYLYFFLVLFILLFGTIFVSTQVNAATLNTPGLTLNVGKSKTLKVKGAHGKIKWKSSKPKVAVINSKGRVTALSKGSTTITASVGSQKITCKVLVYGSDYYDKKVKKKIHSIIGKNIKGNMSTAEKIKVIHDYMVLNCAYDYENYLYDAIPYVSYTPRGVLINKKAVCQGYADTFKLFMDAMNIPCKTVIGMANGGGHAWNVVKVDGKWYQIDVTWDDPVPDRKGKVRYDYFLITDSVMAKTHTWSRKSYPKCTASSSKFISLFGTVSTTEQAIVDHLYQEYCKHNGKMTVICPKSLIDSTNGISTYTYLMKEKYNISYSSFNSYWYSSSSYGDYYIIEITY